MVPASVKRAIEVKDSAIMKEFRAFIVRGNVVDLAVGIIIGVAFGAVVSSLVADVIMPPVGMALGGMDFKEVYLLLKDGTPAGPYNTLAEATAAGAVTLRAGLFVNTIINFIIVAAAVFFLVKALARTRAQDKAEKVADPTEAPCPHCLMKVPIGAKRCGHCTMELKPAA